MEVEDHFLTLHTRSLFFNRLVGAMRPKRYLRPRVDATRGFYSYRWGGSSLTDRPFHTHTHTHTLITHLQTQPYMLINAYIDMSTLSVNRPAGAMRPKRRLRPTNGTVESSLNSWLTRGLQYTHTHTFVNRYIYIYICAPCSSIGSPAACGRNGGCGCGRGLTYIYAHTNNQISK